MKRLLGALMTIALLGAGCDSTQTPGLQVGVADVDVNTPQLRKLKAAAGVEPCKPGRGEDVDGGLPNVVLPCLGGGPDVNVSSLRGPLVLSFWAQWCAPCRKELPIYQEFSEKYAARVRVIGIDFQDVLPKKALQLVKSTGVTFPLLADPEGKLSANGTIPNLKGLPFLALVDADGKVVHREFVVIKSLGQLEDLVEDHLGVKP